MGNKKLIIIGGGITGLSAAYIAAKEGRKVTVIEGGKSFGGLLNTFEIGGNQLEFYYHHFFTHDAELNWLIEDLGIKDKLFFKKTSMGVFKNGRIFEFNTPVDLLKFKPISFIDKFRFGITSLFLGKYGDWKKYENVSSLEWFKKYSGKTTTNALWAPMLKIKFGPFSDKVPLSWMIGRMRQRLGSRNNGDERLGYLKGSLKVLLDALILKLKELNVEMINDAPVTDLIIEKGQLKKVKTKNREFTSDDVLFTIPGIQLAGILKERYSSLYEKVSQIKYFGAVCVILELDKPLSSIYWLNIADEGFPFGGIIEHTNFIDPKEYKGRHIAYLSRYFAEDEEIAGMTNEQIKEMMLKHIPAVYPEFQSSWLKDVHVFRTNTAATVCDLNFSKKVFNCKTNIEGLYIANMAHIYPDERSTNNSVRVAAEACKVMGINSDYVPRNNSLSGQIGF